jgi:PDZ domain-containing secreted protein
LHWRPAFASAQNVQGTVENIDPAAKTIVVDGRTYQMPEETTEGTPIEELKVGDKVEITVSEEEGGEEEAIQPVMMIQKVEE